MKVLNKTAAALALTLLSATMLTASADKKEKHHLPEPGIGYILGAGLVVLGALRRKLHPRRPGDRRGLHEGPSPRS
jgi:hypothetical protein